MRDYHSDERSFPPQPEFHRLTKPVDCQIRMLLLCNFSPLCCFQLMWCTSFRKLVRPPVLTNAAQLDAEMIFCVDELAGLNGFQI